MTDSQKRVEACDDPYEYAATAEGAMAIIRIYNDLTFLKRMEPVMAEVAKELVRRGVDFSKVQYED